MIDRLPRHLQLMGMVRHPFPPTPDAACYFRTPALERELAEAGHCLLAGKGFVLLTGEVGTGKSTFVRRLLSTLPSDRVAACLIFNTFLQGGALMAAILRDFGLEPRGHLAADADRLNRFLIERREAGQTAVLIIDDAQNLSLRSLEVLRLLSNLETGQEKLLQIVLAGQPELLERLAQPQIRQLTSRIVKHVRLRPLAPAQTRRYVDFRLAESGSARPPRLSPAARWLLHRGTRGNPRRVHLVMDRCLYGVFAGRRDRIGLRLMTAALRDAGPALRRPRRHRRWLALPALALATTLAAWSGRPGEQAAGAAPVPEASAPVVVAASAQHEWQACLAAVAGPEARVLFLPAERVPAALDRAGSPRLCRERRGDTVALAWRQALSARHLDDGRIHDDVARLQRLLAPWQPALKIDGWFGPETRRALADFQRRHALAPSGVADDLTLLLIELTDPVAGSNDRENTHG